MSAPTDRRLEEAVRHLDPPAGKGLWHGGPSPLGAVRGVSPEVALWRPYPDRHSIWALLLHVAYWDYAVWRRLLGAERGGFERSPANFPDVPDPPTAVAWKADRELARQWRDRLVEAVRGFDASRLDDPAGGKGKHSYADLITGIVLHQTYHAGQIQMLKRLAASRDA